ncbi:hypothetical protein DWUX_123 [Desulfovibrio diazotrophicus]|nr:hypothetical protein DWUX_123 [Desulfovibrio diazotrophicus]
MPGSRRNGPQKSGGCISGCPSFLTANAGRLGGKASERGVLPAFEKGIPKGKLL